MANVCVITGGGSGMGLEVAKLLPQDMKVVISGRSVEKLHGAIDELNTAGIEAYPCACDVSGRASVEALADFAAEQGTITKVIHAAGVSPHMADGKTIFAINAGGTIIVNDVFGERIADGGVILNVASMSAYMLPADRVPVQLYQASAMGEAAMVAGFDQVLAQVPEETQPGMAYTMSKNFVVWYTKRVAMKLGKRGVRVVSISPGTFLTPMGKLEGEDAAKFAEAGALGRAGDPVEIARMIAFMVSDDASYLTGTDILYDGGSIAATEVARDAQ